MGRSLIRRHAALIAIGLAAVTWVSSAVAFTIAEDVGEGRRIHSFFDALWWSGATVTTVGYGDIYPITAAGRIIAGFTMVVGVTSFGMLTATLAAFLLRDDDALIQTDLNCPRRATAKPSNDIGAGTAGDCNSNTRRPS